MVLDKNYIIDSRSILDPVNTVFVALQTLSGNGHTYIPSLYEKGVRHFIVSSEYNIDEKYNNANFIIVDSPLDTLKELASKKRKNLKVPVVAITGSRGKTIIKEWAYLLSSGKIARSPRSFNSQIGVPLSILNTDLANNIPFVIETGISKAGEMNSQEKVIRPDIVVITNITNEHIEGFSSREEQIKEKLILAKNASYLIYIKGDTELERIINNFLIPQNPKIKLLPINGYKSDYYKSNIKLALKLLDTLDIKPNRTLLDYLPNIDTRTRLKEGLNNSTLLIDNFTSDVQSISQTLDYARRISSSVLRRSMIIDNNFQNGLKIKSDTLLDISNLASDFGFNNIFIIDSNNDDKLPQNDQITIVTSELELLDIFPPENLNNDFVLFHTQQLSKNFNDIISTFEIQQNETSLDINLDAIVHNYNYFKSKIKPETGIICMLKAFGYGTGSVEIARAIEVQGAAAIAVAVIDEGIELRQKGIKCPIIILNPRTQNLDALREANLEPVIYNFHLLDKIEKFIKINNSYTLNVHIKLETGMRRLGFLYNELPLLIERLNKLPRVNVKSVFSHLATADCLDLDDYTQAQIDMFRIMSNNLEAGLGYSFKRHLLNTAGIIRFPEAQMDMVRLGIGLYGIKTLPGELENQLRNVATLTTRIISLKNWKAGNSIGYGCKGKLTHNSTIATLPVGYADGIDRRLGNKNGYVLVNGHKCPYIGNICMDICMIDVTDVPDCNIGTKVEIFGDVLSINHIADTLETIPYEILTSVSKRVNRTYFRE